MSEPGVTVLATWYPTSRQEEPDVGGIQKGALPNGACVVGTGGYEDAADAYFTQNWDDNGGEYNADVQLLPGGDGISSDYIQPELGLGIMVSFEFNPLHYTSIS